MSVTPSDAENPASPSEPLVFAPDELGDLVAWDTTKRYIVSDIQGHAWLSITDADPDPSGGDPVVPSGRIPFEQDGYESRGMALAVARAFHSLGDDHSAEPWTRVNDALGLAYDALDAAVEARSCADCADEVGEAEIRLNGGLCDDCLTKGMEALS